MQVRVSRRLQELMVNGYHCWILKRRREVPVSGSAGEFNIEPTYMKHNRQCS